MLWQSSLPLAVSDSVAHPKTTHQYVPNLTLLWEGWALAGLQVGKVELERRDFHKGLNSDLCPPFLFLPLFFVH